MRKLLYGCLAALTFAFGSCTLPKMAKMAKDQNLQVDPNPLEVHKDTVAFKMTASLPVKMLKKGTEYRANTYYKYGSSEIALEQLIFKAEDFPASATEQPKGEKQFSFPYKPDYKTGVLQVEGVAAKGGKTKATPRMDVATGVITTSKLVQNAYFAAFAGHGYNNAEEIMPVVIPDFIFEQGRSVLRTSEIKSDKGKQLDGFIAAKNITRTVTITGTHSPEGAERINTKLANERAAAIEKYYRAQMKKYDYKGMADSIRFIQKPVVDDWTEFKAALAKYEGITAEQKDAYLNIINNGSDFESQEKALSKLPTYKKVFKDIYTYLRTAKTEILTIKDKKSDAEISVLAKQMARNETSLEGLSMEELMYAGSLTPSLDEKATIYETATKKGTNWAAHNNLGATYLQQAIENPSQASGLVDKAAAQFDIAVKIQETPEVNANLATIALWQGNPYKAYALATKALNGASSDVARGVNGVKGAAEIYTARYNDAVRSTSSASTSKVNSFNKGLAQLLNKDYANASSSFNEAIQADGNYAIAHYGAAVAAARGGNADGVVSNITNAVKADPSLKEKALTDLEFSKFSTNEAFRNALK